MGKQRGWAVVVAAVIAVGVVVGLLVWQGGRGGGSAGGRDVTTTPMWTTVAADVVSLRRGADEHSVIVEVSLPAGRADCARDLRTELLQEQLPEAPRMIYANVVFSSAGTSVQGACPEHTPAEVTLRTAAPVADRTLVLNAMQPAWAPSGDRYRKCDEVLGCAPPADHCAEEWLNQATLTLDVRVNRVHGVRDVRGCDGTWLVLDVNPAVGDCPPAEGASPCRVPPQTTRWFMHFGQNGWAQVTGTKQGGCDQIVSVRPDFPTSLCAGLPAVG